MQLQPKKHLNTPPYDTGLVWDDLASFEGLLKEGGCF